MENREIFNSFHNALQCRYKQVGNSYEYSQDSAGFSWIQPKSPRYCAEFTTMCNNIFGNTEISKRIDHKLVKDTPNAAWINRNPRRIVTIREIFSHNSYNKRPVHASGASVPKWSSSQSSSVELILQLECWKRPLILLEENNYVKVKRP